MSLFGSLEYFGASFKTCMIFSDHVTTPLHTLKSKVFPKLHSRFLMQMFRGRWEVGSLCFYSKNLSEVPETSLKIAVGQNLTTLGVVGTFGITSLPQRLISQSLYKEIILLQKLLDIGGKVLNPQKISLQPQKKKWGRFLALSVNCFGDLGLKNWRLGLKVFVPTSKMEIRPLYVKCFKSSVFSTLL